MKIVLAGCYPETAKKAIKECFPDDWEIRIVSPEAAEGELADVEVLPPEHPLRDLDKVILTPHTAGLPDGVRFHRKRFAFFAGNIARFLNHETPECRLNEV